MGHNRRIYDEVVGNKGSADRFYSKYETYLYPIVKFAVALALFTVINTNIGFMEKISRFPVALLLALVCAILPTGAILWIGAIVCLRICMRFPWK